MSDKVCRGCGVVLVVGDNIPNGRYTYRDYHCNVCHKKHLQNKPLPEGDRFCRVCNSKLIVGDNWYKSQAIRNANICKSCHLEWRRDYKNKNRDAVNETRRKHYRINQPRLYMQQLKWREENPEKVREIATRYKENHPERIKDSVRKSRTKNRDKYKIRAEKWREDNKDRIAETARTYRERNPILVKAWRKSWNALNPEKVKEMDRNKYTRARSAKITAYLTYRRERTLIKQLLAVTT